MMQEPPLTALSPFDDSIPPFAAPPPRRIMSQKQKAAIVVRLLLSDGADLSLDRLPEDMQIDLTHQMGSLRHIDHDTLAAVVDEFLDDLSRIGLSFPGGLEGALGLLEGAISPATVARLRKQAGFAFTGNPWERICDLDAARLLPVLTDEAVEVGAILLAKLKVSKAAELLGMLPGDRARKITYAISLTGGIAPDIVHKIGMSLLGQLDALPTPAFTDGPVNRVGAILNSSPAATRDDVLAGLDETDQAFAEQVRKSIFTYGNIATRIAPRDIPKIIRDIDQETLVRALAGAGDANAATTNFILSNISQRMADNLREEMKDAGQIRPKDAEEAMSGVVAAIRALEAEGEIFLITEEED